MAVQTVFSDNLDPDNGSLTARFVNATAFYIDVPLLNAELEIDVYLQVYFPTATGERLRNLTLGKLKDGQIKLNEADTETVVPIPNEFIDSGLEMAIYFTPSDTTFLEVYVLGLDCTLCTLDAKLDAILENLETVGSEDFQNALVQFLVDNLLPLAVNALLPGVNNLLLTVINNVLLPGIQSLLPGGTTPALPGAASSISLTGTTVNSAVGPTATNNFSATRFT